MHVFALVLAAAMATATPHSAMQGQHSKMSAHPNAMATSHAMHSNAMHSNAMHTNAMKGHSPKPASTPK